VQEPKLYTQEQFDIELIKHEQTKIFYILEKMNEKFDKMDEKIDRTFRWLFGVMVSGFAGLFGIMAHGFHWI
jgi:hypothetical protein